jgi:hypothetical protein
VTTSVLFRMNSGVALQAQVSATGWAPSKSTNLLIYFYLLCTNINEKALVNLVFGQTLVQLLYGMCIGGGTLLCGQREGR